jgi:hypothetical protein
VRENVFQLILYRGGEVRGYFFYDVIPHLPTGQAGLMRNPESDKKANNVWVPAGVYPAL